MSDKAVNDLSCDTSRLAFTWLLTFADVEGRVFGDPALVASMLFPRRRDVTAAKMERFISEWAAGGLVNVYEVTGDRFMEFPSFSKHQIGLRHDRESPSTIPPNPNALETEQRRSSAGVEPESVQSDSAPSIRPSRSESPRASEEDSLLSLSSDESNSGTQDASAECSWCSKPIADTGGTRYLLQRWHDLYRDTRGVCPTIKPRRDGGILKGLLTSGRSEADVTAAMGRYLQDQDSFVSKNGYSLQLFSSRIDAYRTKGGTGNGLAVDDRGRGLGDYADFVLRNS